ncbi:MAG: hypothetical protein LBI73_03060 [Myroides sp.]|jgi:hypothetical protein|nr:hypothetical protein [Myroides sp.]
MERELQLVMQTLMARFTTDTTHLIHGVKEKINTLNEAIYIDTKEVLDAFVACFIELLYQGLI